MYKHLFGPVPSRRLGISLGVDLVPHKVCSLDCVYCECFHTTKITLERLEYVLYEKVTRELEHFFANNPDPDFITFSGSGEPTLNIRIGDVIRFIKHIKPGISLAVLTNGTLLGLKRVRNELMMADVVLPSLDAATDATFKKINRPYKDLDISDYINGIVAFRREFKGQIWLEVLIIPGYNDSEHELVSLKNAIELIHPDRIQLNTLDRPGTLSDIRAATNAELKYIADFWKLSNVEIVAASSVRKNIKSYRKDTESAIMETVSRRPCTVEDLSIILGMHQSEVNKYLDVLEAEKKIISLRQDRGVFYKSVGVKE